MSFFARRAQRVSNVDGPVIPPRDGRGPLPVAVTNDSALRHSAVWAAVRLRADLMSTFPVDNYRKVNGLAVELPKPPILVAPGGERWDYPDWMYATQVDLDRTGNTIGLITARTGNNLPARIDLQAIDRCTVVVMKDTGEIRYRIDGKEYAADQVWHERQYVMAGCPVGLSPIAYAARSIAEFTSMQDFVLKWFGAGGTPNAHLRNTRRTIPSGEARTVKETWRASVSVGDPIVTGMDWEYKPIQAEAVGQDWLEGRRYGLSDIARFFAVPADLIEASIAGGASVTYANLVQRNLQFLIMNLGPAVARREKNLSKLLPSPRYVKLNTAALLRMDPVAQAQAIQARITARTLTVTEARALYDLPPLTPEQEAEFVRLFGAPRQPGEPAQSRAATDPSIMDLVVQRELDDEWTNMLFEPINAGQAGVGAPIAEVEG